MSDNILTFLWIHYIIYNKIMILGKTVFIMQYLVQYVPKFFFYIINHFKHRFFCSFLKSIIEVFELNPEDSVLYGKDVGLFFYTYLKMLQNIHFSNSCRKTSTCRTHTRLPPWRCRLFSSHIS